MKLTWICPTWNRPKLLANLIRQFLAQDYPADQLELLILDDAGQYENQRGDRWQLISFDRPFATLPEKYNALLGMVTSDAVVIAEDDDLYSPQHSAVCAAALAFGEVCKSSRVLTHVHGVTREEDATGRFHASIAFQTAAVRKIGGWPITHRADFDLQFLAKLRDNLSTVNPLLMSSDPDGGLRLSTTPTYTFTWEGSGHYHAQAYGQGPTDEGWLARARAAAGQICYVGRLTI